MSSKMSSIGVPPPSDISAKSDLVVGILAPFTGGFYFGSVLKGIHHVAAAAGVSTFALQTTGLDLIGNGDDEERIASRAADAWVVINEAADHPFVERLIAQGIPTIAVHAARNELQLSSVRPANEVGMYKAVTHLIEHGHRRIAFAGNRGQLDIEERYQGYRRALRDAGITEMLEDVYLAPFNLEPDGKLLGRQLTSHPLQFTALAAATDKLAIGILQEFSSSGVRVPEDVAMVSFDDIEKAQYVQPPLSTVRQNFTAVGSRAAEALISHLLNSVPLPPLIRVDGPFIPRRSCGCSISRTVLEPPPSREGGHNSKWLLTALLKLAGEAQGIALLESEWPRARQIVERLDAAAGDLPWLSAQDKAWRTIWDGFGQYNRSAESINEALALLEAYVRFQDLDAEAEKRVADVMLELRAALLLSWQRTEQQRRREYESVAETMARISHAIASQATGLSLDWLQHTDSTYGALGLWHQEGSSRQLDIECEYETAHLTEPGEIKSFTPANFPPRWLAPAINARGASQILMLVPLVGRDECHGMLAVGTDVDAELLDHVVHVGDWAAQLGASLDQERAAQQLRDHALHDTLTGLPNRAALLEHLSGLNQDVRAPTFALLFLDLDDFKKVNDSLGHHAGDALLIQVAERLLRAVGERGLVARLGGDEFVIVLHQCPDEANAEAVIEEVQRLLAPPMLLDGGTAFVSASIGVSFGVGSEHQAADLLREADTAMYRAKLRGPAQHAMYHRSMHEQAVERLRLEEQLRDALDKEEFELKYQPIVALENGKVVGAEALIRWRHPQQGYMLPSRFIPIAEDVGLIVPLGEWVMQSACREAARWRSDGHDIYVTVNVAAAQLKDERFVDKVADLLQETGLPGRALSIELLENSLIEQLDVASVTLSMLRRLGVRVSIDDFGTGYSSLNYLKQLPADVLKLDRSFVERVPESNQDAAIISAVLTMGRGLGLKVIAEGVESLQQADFLAAAGCKYVQGYLFSKPLALEDWLALLAKGTALRAPQSTRLLARHSSLPPLVQDQTRRSSFPPE